ncbi:asparagine synthase [Alicyclobacillus dauci]|uniref:Asparagine synthase n=1 Tax=Alicyclobacillus dauci TaxID=1475485 RepID=A0ABY6Z888_9BACL|nr:asparagine synthase [Alicyclobacillus dauci]WAH38748.1 asparagine synthase [Alicyclobacillus dauci]
MGVREGLIPTILGAAVTATGIAMRQSRMNPTVSWSVTSFGVAQALLGVIDLMEHQR